MVRAILNPGRNKGAITSLLMAIAAAVVIWAGFWVWHREDQTISSQRRINDVVVRWRCPNQHVFEANGATKAIPCPTCGQPAHVLVTYVCPEHGEFEMLVMYDEETGRPCRVQWKPGKWIPVSTIIPCPQCNEPIHPKRRNPFDELTTAQKQKADAPSDNPPS